MSISQKDELYISQNEYILFCDFLNKTPNKHIKLDLFEVYDLIINFIERPPTRQNILYQYLIELQLKLMRLDGISWWDNCNWNSNNATISTAKNLHSIVLLTYNINER
jgi:hypothetical protein